MEPNKVAIIGYGWVGKAMHKLFPEALIYDPLYIGPYDGTEKMTEDRGKINACKIAFVCVPTPNETDVEDPNPFGEGRLNTSIVEEVVEWCESELIVIRSTVNPGTCDALMKKYHKRLVMQPEYLGETPAHPMLDPKTRPFLIIGGADTIDRRKLIDLYSAVYNANVTIRQVSNLEAEVIKLTENRAIAFKVAQCQELFDVCELANVDYYTIRDAVYGDDPRFNLWFSFIFPNARGMNSKCIPKDVYAWAAWAESLNYSPKLTRSLLEKNKEWIKK